MSDGHHDHGGCNADPVTFRAVLTGLGQRIHEFLPIAERHASQRRPVELA